MTDEAKEPTPTIKVSKMDAARRQLATAITIWFANGDEVSVYTLAHAAYEIIHNLTRTTRTRDLLFDSMVIKDEYRKEFNKMLRGPANFFKHASRNKAENIEIEFHPVISELFFLFSIFALELVQVSLRKEERCFALWHMVTNPQFLTEKGRKMFAELPQVEGIDKAVASLGSETFFRAFMAACRQQRR